MLSHIMRFKQENKPRYLYLLQPLYDNTKKSNSIHKCNIIQAYHPVALLTIKFGKQCFPPMPEIRERTSNSTRDAT